MRALRQTLLAVLFLTLALDRASADQILFRGDFSHGFSQGWQNVTFFKKLTDYQACREGTNYFLLGVADKGCSALSMKLNLAPPPHLKLRWRWRIDGVATNGSERALARFDHAARVFVAFDTFLGPPRTLNYLWGNVEPPGTILEHPKSSRAKLIVLESGNGKAGHWRDEERNLSADWQLAFPGQTMPKLTGLGVMTDGDSLGAKLTGAYADIELIGSPN